MLCGYEGHTVCREGSEGRDSSRPWSPKNGGKGVDSELSMETVLAGFVSLYPPYNWIPAFAGMTSGSQSHCMEYPRQLPHISLRELA